MNSWQKLSKSKPQEYSHVLLTPSKGSLPINLKGTLFRNTSAFVHSLEGTEGHWFDGDGGIFRLNFRGDQAIASYKMIETQGYKDEQKIGHYQLSNVGRRYKGNILTRAINSLKLKNAANTSVLPLKNGPLLALWEGGWPHALHSDTLQTFGEVNLGGIKKGDWYSAHPKVCPKSGHIYNIGLSQGKQQSIVLYESKPDGNLINQKSHQLSQTIGMLHDFALAGKYIVVFQYPIIMNAWDMLLGRKSLMDAISYQPTKGTELMIFDRNTLELVSQSTLEASWYSWHYANGYVDNQEGNIIIDLVTYKDFKTFDQFRLTNLLSAKPDMAWEGFYERLTIEPNTAKLLKREKLFDDNVEFPFVSDDEVSLKWDTTYCAFYSGASKRGDFQDGIVRYSGNQRVKRTFETGNFVSEPIFVRDPQAKTSKQGWVLTVRYDGIADQSLVDVLDAENLESVCTLPLPSTQPLGFHGRFLPN